MSTRKNTLCFILYYLFNLFFSLYFMIIANIIINDLEHQEENIDGLNKKDFILFLIRKFKLVPENIEIISNDFWLEKYFQHTQETINNFLCDVYKATIENNKIKIECFDFDKNIFTFIH